MSIVMASPGVMRESQRKRRSWAQKQRGRSSKISGAALAERQPPDQARSYSLVSNTHLTEAVCRTLSFPYTPDSKCYIYVIPLQSVASVRVQKGKHGSTNARDYPKSLVQMSPLAATPFHGWELW